MSNLEENQQGDDISPVNQQSATQENSSGKSNKADDSSEASKSANSGSEKSKGVDPKHNTGNEHMRIDEEGTEIGPDDEV
jgi:hypothetical protein